MISFKDNRDLYCYEDGKWIESLAYANSLKPYRTKEKMVFNLYWRVPRVFERKQILPIKSIIANHELHNSKNYQINLWSNVDLSEHELLKPYAKYITHKIWNPLEELIGTPLESHIPYFKSVFIDDEKCYLGGDFFRIVCLFKYGGFYLDMDMCVLRDLSPLSQLSFVYQWGESGTTSHEPDIYYNGAIMRLEKNTQTSFEFLKQLRMIPPQPNTTCWGSSLYGKIISDDLKYLPCSWFNTEWSGCTTPPVVRNGYCPMKNIGEVKLYDGAFTWHWHNKWDDVIEEGSKFEILEKITEEKLNDLKIGVNK